jgi:hypothetical protein
MGNNVCPDPGFEQVPSLWTLGTNCAWNTAEIQTVEVYSGSRALMISSAKIGVTTRCGYAEIVAPTVPGRGYRISCMQKSSSTIGRNRALLVNGITRLQFAPSTTAWKFWQSAWFVIPGATAVIRCTMPTGIGPVVTTFWDNIVLDAEEPVDAAAPSSLSGRAAASDPSSQSGVLASPEEVRAVAQSLGMVASPSSLAVRGRASRLP